MIDDGRGVPFRIFMEILDSGEFTKLIYDLLVPPNKV